MRIRCLQKKNAKAVIRLARQRAFNDILERLAGHRGGKTFAVDTNHLKQEPPCIHVTERYSLLKLKYAFAVAALCSYHNRRFEIEFIENTITYIIY